MERAALEAVAPGRVGDAAASGLRVLLVEDDDGDALLVEELFADSHEAWSVTRVRSLADAIVRAPSFECAVVDLGLPDGVGLANIDRLRAAAPDLAIVVLTGLDDRALGVAAVAAGAHDYLVKGEVTGVRLGIAVRYAIERRRAELVAQALVLAARRQDENDRLARGLLPSLQLHDRPIEAATYYRPGSTSVLGGDFFDAVALADGTVRAVIGDVCGHGPSEAALGVALRIAWRAMTLGECDPGDVLTTVDTVLRLERDEALFATLCDLTFPADVTSVTVRLHGHPPPLLRRHGRWTWLTQPSPALPIGIATHEPAPPFEYQLDDDWALLLVTDGVYEGWRGDRRLGMDGLVEVLDELTRRGVEGEELLALVGAVTAGDDVRPHDDDVALLWLAHR